MAREFDWDKWLARASYSEVAALSPAVTVDRPFPCYSPDRRFFYLNTMDFCIDVTHQEELEQQLLRYKELFAEAIASSDYRRAWLIQVECREICNLLSELVAAPEDYGNPDDFLR